jgi:hypothetical protein
MASPSSGMTPRKPRRRPHHPQGCRQQQTAPSQVRGLEAERGEGRLTAYLLDWVEGQSPPSAAHSAVTTERIVTDCGEQPAGPPLLLPAVGTRSCLHCFECLQIPSLAACRCILGTGADLRRLSNKRAGEILETKFGLDPAVVQTIARWDRIDLIRT